MAANNQTVPREQRVEAILGAALIEFASSGYDTTTIASVARRAGMTAPNVHYYFATKDALFAAMAEQAYGELFGSLDVASDPLSRLYGYLRFHRSNHPLRAAFLAVAARSAEVSAVVQRREAWVEATVAELVANGPSNDDQRTAAVLVAVVTGLIEAAEPRHDAEDVLAHAVHSLLGVDRAGQRAQKAGAHT
jgi:AcrR family transcriptional regulator